MAPQDYVDQPAPPRGPVPGRSANRSGPIPQVPRTAGRPQPAQPTSAATPSAGPYGYDGSGYGYSNSGGSGYSNDYGYGSNDRGYGNGGRTGPYMTEAHPSGPIPTGPYPTDAHPSGPIPTGPYRAEAHPSGPIPAGPYRAEAHPSGPFRTGPYTTEPHRSGRRPGAMPPGAPSTWNGPAVRDQPRQGIVDPRNGGSVSMVARILSVADYEAASITQQASYQAAMITRQVAHEATEIREAAKREADEIMEQASEQASAVLEAAQIEAAEVRTKLMSMQTELSEFAERISNTLPNPVLPRKPQIERAPASPAVGPPANLAMSQMASPVMSPPMGDPATSLPMGSPATGPAASLATPPLAPPRTVPARKPIGKPTPRTAGKPASGQGRQRGAIRFATIATSVLFLVALIGGITEIHLHGFDFFVFRAAATGESSPNFLQEDQGPGQPDAPKPKPTAKPTTSHIKARPSKHSKVTVHKAQKK